MSSVIVAYYHFDVLSLDQGTTYFKTTHQNFWFIYFKIFSKNTHTKQTKSCVRLGHYRISEDKQ